MDDSMNRRQVLAGAAAAVAVVAVADGAGAAPPAAAADAKASGAGESPTWGEPQDAPPEAAAAEPDAKRMGDAVTFIFDDFRVELRGEQGGMSQSRAWGVRLPLTVPEGRALLGYAHDLRLAVNKTVGAAVMVVGDFGGMPLVVDLPAERVPGGDVPPPGPGGMSRHVFTFAAEPGPGGAAAAVPPHAVTLLVSARRTSAADEVEVSIDSLDLRAVTEPAGRTGGEGRDQQQQQGKKKQ